MAVGDKTTIMNKNVYIVYGGQLNSKWCSIQGNGLSIETYKCSSTILFAPFLIVHYKLELQFKDDEIERGMSQSKKKSEQKKKFCFKLLEHS